MSSLSIRFQQLISVHYVVGKYALHKVPITVDISDDIFMADNSGTKFAVGYMKTVWVLQNFGHLFQFINIHYSAFGSDESTKITHYIHEHCSDALREIAISGIKGDRLEHWPFSFKNVQSLSIADIGVSDGIRLDQLFPRLKKLMLENVSETGFIARHFPDLVDASIKTPPNITASEENIMEFIRLNRQLQALKTPLLLDATYLSFVNDRLPHLKSLTIYVDAVTNSVAAGAVHFERVEKFAIFVTDAEIGKIVVRQILPVLLFDRLEQFEISAALDTIDDDEPIRFAPTHVNSTEESSDLSTSTDESDELVVLLDNTVDELIEIVIRNRRLKNVTINRTELTYSQLTYLTGSLPELDELRIDWNQLPALYEIRRFLMEPTHVRKVAIPMFDRGWGSKHILQILPAEWQISGVEVAEDRKLLLLTRADA